MGEKAPERDEASAPRPSMSARRTPTALVALVALLGVGTTLLAAATGTLNEHGSGDFVLSLSIAAVYLLFSAAGWLIVTRQPGNTVGQLLIAIPLVAATAGLAGNYATYALVTHPGSLPFGRAAAWVDRWAIVPALAMFIPLFLLFPDGRIPSRRWRPALWLAIGGPLLATVAFAVTPGRMTGAFADLQSVRVINPLGLDVLGRDAANTIAQVGGFLTLAAAVLAAAAIVVRYRGARGEVRQQIRWLAFVAVLFFAVFAAGLTLAVIAGDESHIGDVAGNVMFVLLTLILALGIPGACALAILKYRLYDLDVVVRKAVVFGVLAVFITVVYAAIVGGVGAVVGSRSNTVASFVAAAVLAVAFAPVRDRARHLADRLVYGKRATPYEVLTEFSSRVATTYATTDVLVRMAQILGAGTGARRARIWLRVGSELRPEASWPTDEPAPSPLRLPGDGLPEFPGETGFEVRHHDELLGALTVAMPPADPMNPAKAKLVADLAAQAGLVLRNVRLIEELRDSRRRLVAAQDEARRRLERNIHDGAQQQLVALAIKLGLAESLVDRDPAKARELMSALRTESSEALENLRDLARGIYPPLLADQGLASALTAQARKSPISVTVESDGIGRYPQEVEATVYFCALEALQNVAKYADATHATVRLAISDGLLTFEVTDDGNGFDPAATGYGTGLQGMADRLDALGGTLTVQSARGSGTTVTGRVSVSG
jgi:signal transduction histidine kinase